MVSERDGRGVSARSEVARSRGERRGENDDRDFIEARTSARRARAMWAARISRNSFADDGRGSRALRAVARARTLEDVEVGRGAPRRAIAMSVVTRLDPWPSEDELTTLRADVVAFARSEGAGEVDPGDVRVVAAPYRVCPLGAHIDHQGGRVAGFALNCGVAPSSPRPRSPPPSASEPTPSPASSVSTPEMSPAKGVAGEACEWAPSPRRRARLPLRARRAHQLGADADVDVTSTRRSPAVGCLRAYPSGWTAVSSPPP